MNINSIVRLALGAIPMLAACANLLTGPREASPDAVALLRDAAGQVVGEVQLFKGAPGAVRTWVRVQGVTPGAHGIHIHAIGKCDATTGAAFSSAGGHFNPTSKEHGHLNPAGAHGGDLPNVMVAQSGTGLLEATAEQVTITDGPATLFDADGSALVLHQNEDDLRTNSGPQGPGNSGARIACGVITRR